MVTKEEWLNAQQGEKQHWIGENPEHMYLAGELHGQVVGYAKYLGLEKDYLITPDHNFQNYNLDYYKDPRYDLQGKDILDIGGGPTSLLLRCKNFICATVVDPLPMSEFALNRYKDAGICLVSQPAEDFEYQYKDKYDEIWIYNCLHHVMNPSLILKNAIANTKCLRIMECLYTPIDYMHPQSFTPKFFEEILGSGGTVSDVYEPAPSPRGTFYYGVFRYD